jgi:hypothetical protein
VNADRATGTCTPRRAPPRPRPGARLSAERILINTQRSAIVVAVVLLVVATPVLADRAAGNRCAAALPPAAKSLYDKALNDVLAGNSLEDALTPPARWMVITGSISAADAKVAAAAAAECLERAR